MFFFIHALKISPLILVVWRNKKVKRWTQAESIGWQSKHKKWIKIFFIVGLFHVWEKYVVRSEWKQNGRKWVQTKSHSFFPLYVVVCIIADSYLVVKKTTTKTKRRNRKIIVAVSTCSQTMESKRIRVLSREKGRGEKTWENSIYILYSLSLLALYQNGSRHNNNYSAKQSITINEWIDFSVLHLKCR